MLPKCFDELTVFLASDNCPPSRICDKEPFEGHLKKVQTVLHTNTMLLVQELKTSELRSNGRLRCNEAVGRFEERDPKRQTQCACCIERPIPKRSNPHELTFSGIFDFDCMQTVIMSNTDPERPHVPRSGAASLFHEELKRSHSLAGYACNAEWSRFQNQTKFSTTPKLRTGKPFVKSDGNVAVPLLATHKSRATSLTKQHQ